MPASTHPAATLVRSDSLRCDFHPQPPNALVLDMSVFINSFFSIAALHGMHLVDCDELVLFACTAPSAKPASQIIGHNSLQPGIGPSGGHR
ncbi:hypothetical protein DXT94_29835 [Rhizobium sp. ICMP 5592]|nr:hypothetical protein [Rhizobium sp. ICMP 5592]